MDLTFVGETRAKPPKSGGPTAAVAVAGVWPSRTGSVEGKREQTHPGGLPHSYLAPRHHPAGYPGAEAEASGRRSAQAQPAGHPPAAHIEHAQS